MTRTKLSNTEEQYSRDNLLWQLRNVESAMNKHPIDSREFFYLVGEREIILGLLELA